MAAGRPTDYTPELADRICALLAEGKSVRTICQADDMPDKSTIFRWLRINEQFSDQYARAKDESTDAIVEDMLDIADRGNLRDTQRARLRVDTRKWYLSKLKPKKYGDKMQLSGDPDEPLVTRVERVIRHDAGPDSDV